MKIICKVINNNAYLPGRFRAEDDVMLLPGGIHYEINRWCCDAMEKFYMSSMIDIYNNPPQIVIYQPETDYDDEFIHQLFYCPFCGRELEIEFINSEVK